MSISDLLKELDQLGAAKEKKNYIGDLSKDAKELRLLNDLLSEKEEFKVGDIVVWKHKKLMNKRAPLFGQPVVVLEARDKPIYDSNTEGKGSSSTYFQEPLDLVLGMIDEDGDFLSFNFDSRRFTKKKA